MATVQTTKSRRRAWTLPKSFLHPSSTWHKTFGPRWPFSVTAVQRFWNNKLSNFQYPRKVSRQQYTSLGTLDLVNIHDNNSIHFKPTSDSKTILLRSTIECKCEFWIQALCSHKTHTIFSIVVTVPGSVSFSSSDSLLPYFFKISSSSASISSCDLLAFANGRETTFETCWLTLCVSCPVLKKAFVCLFLTWVFWWCFLVCCLRPCFLGEVGFFVI